MNKCLDYYRGLLKDVSPDQYGKSLYNIMNTYRLARGGRLSGMTFDGIDFGNVPLNDLHFSDDGENPAEFKNCKFHELNFMTGHSANVTHAEFSDDGKYVLSVDETNTFIFWETESGLQLGKYTLPKGLLEPGDKIMGIAFAGLDEKSQKPLKLMAYTRDGVRYSRSLIMSDDAAWTAEQLLTGEYADCIVITYSPDKSLALIRKAFTEEYLEQIKAEMLADPGAPSPEQEYWIYDLKGNREPVTVWNAVGVLIRPLKSSELKLICNAVFTQDNQYLLMSENGRNLKMWSSKNGIEVWKSTEQHMTNISAFGCSRDGSVCVSGGVLCDIIVWKTKKDNWNYLDEVGYNPKYENLIVSSNGDYCLAVNPEACVLWDLKTMSSVDLERSHYGYQYFHGNPLFLENGEYCIILKNNIATVWNVKTGMIVSELGGNLGEYTATVSPNKKYAVCTENVIGSRSILLDLCSGKSISTIDEVLVPGRFSLQFSFDSSQLILTRIGRIVSIYKTNNGEKIDSFNVSFQIDTPDVFWGMNNDWCLLTEIGSSYAEVWGLWDGIKYSQLETMWDLMAPGNFQISDNNRFVKLRTIRTTEAYAVPTSINSVALSKNKNYLAYTMGSDIKLLKFQIPDYPHDIRIGSKENISYHYKVLDISDDGTEILLVPDADPKDEAPWEAEWWSTEETPRLLRKERLSEDVRNYLFPKPSNYPTQSTNGILRIPAQDGEPEKILYLIPNLYIKECRFIDTKATPEVKKILYQYGAKIELAD